MQFQATSKTDTIQGLHFEQMRKKDVTASCFYTFS